MEKNAQFGIEQRKERHKRFFEPPVKGEGAVLSVISPIDDSGKPPFTLPPPKDLHEQWLCPEYSVMRAEANEQNTYWGLDALHSVFVNLGPGVMASFVGAPYTLTPGSVWFDLEPPIKNWDEPPDLKINTEHELYKVITEKTKALCEASKGRYSVSVTDIGGQMDVLFSLRGEDILTDMLEYPDEVKKAEKQLTDEWLKYFNEMTDIIKPTGCGYATWGPIVSDKPWYITQCDMSVMISPAMFEEFVLPELDKISTAIGRTVYHLDGPEEIRHQDMLLSIKNNTAIQWTPLPNQIQGKTGLNQDFSDELSFNVYRRTLAAGKKVVLFFPPAEQIEKIFNEVGSDNFYIITHIPSRKEADDFISHARKQKWVTV